MIYITGDTHIPIDIHKLSMKEFPEQKNLTKQDYVIICGDFGGVWNNGKEEMFWRNWLRERTFTTLFVDGNHENFYLLDNMTTYQWQGGNVHFINESVIHLMRGQVFTIDGLKFFTMGGACSVDKAHRTLNVSWWKEEEISLKDTTIAMYNLSVYDWKVDYIISHTCSGELRNMMGYTGINDNNNSFFSNIIEPDLSYKHWYFGHFHRDKQLDDKHTVVYDKIIMLKD